MRHVVGLRKRDKLEGKRLEENSINAWMFSLLKGGHVLMMMRQRVTSRFPWGKHILRKNGYLSKLPPINMDFCVNEGIYQIAPSSIHGLGLYSMDGTKVSYKKVVELMDYVAPCYNYNNWMQIVQ